MITLLTGMPGAGKTAALVDLLSKLDGSRPLFVDGLNGLTLPHTPVEASDWPNQVPDGGILVIDEAQRVWRPRGPASKVPESVAMMETHRHRGIDIYMTTQAPRLIDSNVRGLIGRHIHIRDVGWYGRWWYEWPEVNEGTSWKTCPNKRRYKLPKNIFHLYKSASEHHKPVRGVPRMLWVVLALFLVMGALAFMVSRSIAKKSGPDKPPEVPSAVPGAPGVLTGGGSQMVQVKTPPPDERIAFVPRIGDRPHTAKAYDDLVKVVRVPYISGAMCVNDSCRCYADGEYVPEVSSAACKDWAENKPFNPYVLAKVPQPQSSTFTDKQMGDPRAGAGGMGAQTPM